MLEIGRSLVDDGGRADPWVEVAPSESVATTLSTTCVLFGTRVFAVTILSSVGEAHIFHANTPSHQRAFTVSLVVSEAGS